MPSLVLFDWAEIKCNHKKELSMKKNMLFLALMSFSFIVAAEPVDPSGSDCSGELQVHGTTVNGVDTTQWVTITGVLPSEEQLATTESRRGLGCNGDLNIGSDAQSGDYAFIYDEFEMESNEFGYGEEDHVSYQFELNLSGLVNSYTDGDGLVIFQVRTENELEDRFLNVSLYRYRDVSDENPYSDFTDGWELKLAWFKPKFPSEEGGRQFEKLVDWVDLGSSTDGLVHVLFDWTPSGSEVLINGVTYQNPHVFSAYINPRPFHTRLGYNYTAKPLKSGDTLRFQSVLPEN
jgi:hypothetical protein